MVDGVFGCVDLVVRHVVVEYDVVLDGVPILHLGVEERDVLAQELSQYHVQVIAVLVRL